MTLNMLIGILEQGLIYGIMAMGLLITYRIPEGADERLRTALREASSGSVIPSLLEEIFCAG